MAARPRIAAKPAPTWRSRREAAPELEDDAAPLVVELPLPLPLPEVVVAALVVVATRPPELDLVGVALLKVVLRDTLIPVPDALAGPVTIGAVPVM